MSYTVGFTDNSQPGPSGPITAWAWEFGDGGTSSSQNPTHAYASTGNYSVKLTVTGTGSDGTASITSPITVIPTGALASFFSYSVSGLGVTFTDASVAGPSGPITGWAWNFGDSNTSTSQNPSHTYGAAGSYTVTLTVTGTSPDGTAVTTHAVPVTSASPNFVAATDDARPAFTPARTVNFTTKAQLDAALADLTAGDLIRYTGTGVLTINNASGTAYTIANKNPASPVVIDFGCSCNIWDPSTISNNYVKFAYTGTSGTSGAAALYMHDNSNLRIYGGEYTTGNYGGTGIIFYGVSHDIYLWDVFINGVGRSGIQIAGITNAGVNSTIHDLNFRGEVARFSLNPAADNHADKGTGFHGAILHGASGTFRDSTVTVYAHDSLQPGETSAGHTWPEGGGGSAVEIGQNGGNNNNLTINSLGVNLLMVPDGTNPGSTGTQTGGNVLNFWGGAPLNGCVVGWAEGRNCTGAVVHGAGGAWHPGSPAISVSHGRHTNVNQSTAGGNISTPYDTTHGIVYSDST